MFLLIFGSERILEKVGWGSFCCGEGIHPCLPRVAHIPRVSEMSLMISSLHIGGDRKNLGWALGGLCFQCGSGMGSGDLEQIAFTSLDLLAPTEGPVGGFRGT